MQTMRKTTKVSLRHTIFYPVEIFLYLDFHIDNGRNIHYNNFNQKGVAGRLTIARYIHQHSALYLRLDITFYARLLSIIAKMRAEVFFFCKDFATKGLSFILKGNLT